MEMQFDLLLHMMWRDHPLVMSNFDWLTLIVKAFVALCDGSIVQVEEYNNMFTVEASMEKSSQTLVIVEFFLF
jgi:hypothetical protein